MSLLLAVFTERAHIDILLPVTNNADYTAAIPREPFGLSKRMELELEVLDNGWQFKKNLHYTVKKAEQDWVGRKIVDGDRLTLRAQNQVFSVIVLEQGDALGSYQKYTTQHLGELTIGKDPSCDICYNRLEIVSRHHLSIYFQGSSAVLEDFSVNGVYLNGRRVRGKENLRFSDTISLFGLKIVYLVDTFAINVQTIGATVHHRMEPFRLIMDETRSKTIGEAEAGGENLFHRSPRKIISLYTETEEIEAPPQKQIGSRKPIWMIIGPSFTMAIPMLLGCGFMLLARTLTGTGSNLFMYVGLVTALSSAIIGIAWALINLNYNQKEEKETELLRLQKYGDYLMECAARIHDKYEHNRQAMLEMYPDVESCCRYWQNTQELWNRNRSHTDFMNYRLGLGSIPFQVSIKIPQKRFMLVRDELSERPWEIQQNYAMLTQVPINVDLYAHRVVGVVGSNRAEIARTIIMQIAANNCYTDVKLAILAQGDGGADWSFTKWLPHVWNAEWSQRYVAMGKTEVSGVCYELTQIFRLRSQEAAATNSRKTVLPMQYVVLVENSALLESEPLSKYLLEEPESIGVTTLLLADVYENLPNSCDYILEGGRRFSGMYSMAQGGEKPQSIQYDTVSLEAAEQMARKISGIRVVEAENGSDLPDSLTFFDMLGIHSLPELNVIDNWRKNRTYQTMQAMIGWKTGNAPCYLNIHEKFHGPHGLVAGTTGSGKSETLQSYILSLAINYSPQDVGFFIIDFKGGGMANLFSGLPHVLGSVSNLSGNQVRRAMVSIKSENMRRQRIFNEYGVNHIDAYTKLVKNNEATMPIPHLLIIIDEFAELKREQPEFMKELISVAQVGRSLGVHLILSTQKPAGTVDDNIWSNTKFRLCLRVADKQDSKDMLHKSDAAYLTQAGRCYLQVGNDEIYELFQSGWSGAVYDEDTGIAGNCCAVQLENSGKVVMTGGNAKARKLMEKKRRWIENLVKCCKCAEQSDGQIDLDEVFREIQYMGLNYSDSTYNRRQMSEFIGCYRELFTAEEGDAAREIIASSEKNGKQLPEQKEKTQLEAVVEYLGRMAPEHDCSCNLKLWMPVLPERLLLDNLMSREGEESSAMDWNRAMKKTTLRTAIGLIDDPQNQTQFPLVVDFLQGGHLAICGAVSSGKSTLMQTLVYGLTQCYTPDMLNIYAIDYSSQMLQPFEALPHTGGIVCEGETDKLDKLFLLLNRILKQRRVQFRGGSFLQYITVHGNAAPAILLVLDGYASFREKTGNAYEERLLELARDGAGVGIFLCISSGGFGAGEIQVKLGDKIRQVLCLEMDSKYSYGDCLRTMHFDVLPESGVRGRGLAQCGDSILEFQTALVAEGDDYHRSECIRTRCEKIAALWNGKCAEAIPEIPENPVWEKFSQLTAYKELVQTDRFLPLGYQQQDASLYAVDLSQIYCYFISGRERSGKSVFLRNVACAAKDRAAKIYVVDKIGAATEKKTAELVNAEYVNTPGELFELWKALILLINERHLRQKALTEQGLEDGEIFAGMADYQQVFVLIADLPNFIQACINPGGGKASMGPQVENILQKGALHQVYFFGAIQPQESTAASAQGIYRSFVRAKQGVHLGGELNAQKLLTYKNIPFLEQGKSRKPGLGYVPDPKDSINVAEIVVPMNKLVKKTAEEPT